MCVDMIVWRKIPPDSVIEVQVAPVTGTVVAGADVTSPDGTLLEQWSDQELRPGPRIRTIGSGQRLIIEVRVANPGTSSIGVTVTATLKAPGGAILAGPTVSPPIPPCNLQPGTHHLLTIDAQAKTADSPAEAAPAGTAGSPKAAKKKSVPKKEKKKAKGKKGGA